MRNEYRQDAVANLRGWEGNRRSGVALAIVTDWHMHLPSKRPKVGRGAPTYTPVGSVALDCCGSQELTEVYIL